MSGPRRRRKAATFAAVLTLAPLASSVSLQELIPIPTDCVDDLCSAALSTDIPACAMSDFTTGCSKDCQASVSSFSSTLLEACASSPTEEILGPVMSSTGELLICVSGIQLGAIGSAKTTTSTEIIYTTVYESAGESAIPSLPTETTAQSEVHHHPQSQSQSQSTSDSISLGKSVSHRLSSSSALAVAGPSDSLTSTASLLGLPPFVFSVIASLSAASSTTPSLSTEALPLPTSSISAPETATSFASLDGVTSPTSTGAALPQIIAPIPGAPSFRPITISIRPLASTLLPFANTTGAGRTPMSEQSASSLSTQTSSSTSSMSTFMLLPDVPPSSTILPRASTTSSSTSSSTAPATANAANGGDPLSMMSTSDQSKKPNASIIGGVVGGGVGAIVGINVLIYFLMRRRRRQRDQQQGRPFASWDFIDRQQERPTNLPSNPDLSMSYFDQPVYSDQRAQTIAPPEEVIIPRRISRNSAMLVPLNSTPPRQTPNFSRMTQVTASQYSNASIIVGYGGVRNSDNVAYGEPGPAVYNGGPRRTNPSLIDELEVNGMGSMFYDRAMRDMSVQ